MNFYDKVYEHVRKIPTGNVASYGQVAALCGSPRAARQVGFALRALNTQTIATVPWYRVVNSKGYITIQGHVLSAEMQQQLLEQEGVVVTRERGLWRVDLMQYLWQPE